MKIIQGKFAGFCPGVKRAWNLVDKKSQNKKRDIYILGELIHNKDAQKKLNEWGIKTIENPKEIKNGGNVIIRTHGEPPKTYRELKKLGLGIIDATCISVRHVQKLAKQLEKDGYQVILCGEKEHPETIATIGYTQKGVIIDSLKEAKQIPYQKKIGVISKTTFSPIIFKQICQILKKKTSDFKSSDTTCAITRMAQKETKEIAKKVNLMIIVGGKHSSNTKMLKKACQKISPAHHIETAEELKKHWFKGVKKVGLTAGASTPDWVINEVKERISKIND